MKIYDHLTKELITEIDDDLYEAIAAQVRVQDRLDYAKTVLLNYGCNDNRYDNIVNYIANTKPALGNMAESLDNAVNENTGETEYSEAEKAIKKACPKLCSLKLNNGRRAFIVIAADDYNRIIKEQAVQNDSHVLTAFYNICNGESFEITPKDICKITILSSYK